MQYDDYAEEDLEDWPDDYGDDQPELIDCPACGAEIYEESEQCPVCGEYIVADTSPWTGKPLWWIVLAGAGILATVATLML